MYAASRDRSIYAWNWPREKPDEDSSPSTTTTPATDEYNVLVPEPAATLQGHSLGVTALAHNEGVCACV